MAGPKNGQVVASQAGAVVKQEFGAKELRVQTETASAAVAAQAQATVQARYVMALQRPRDMDDVRIRLLKECERPGFADAARYHKPIGDGIEGPSIRFAEAAIRMMGNILVESPVIYDDTEKRIVRITATDLETNATFQSDVVIAKTVERSFLRDGQEALSVRTNSYGRKTFLVAATEDDLLNKQNALVSKAVRTNGLRLLPGDILEECMDRCVATLNKKDAADPKAALMRLTDAFAALGVKPSDLKAYLGHELEQITPPEMVKLRGLHNAIRDGETTWSAAMESKGKATGTTAPAAPAAAAKPSAPAEKKPEAEQKADAPAAAPEESTAKPAEVVPFPKPDTAAPPHDPQTGEVIDDPAEAELAQAFAAATKRSDVLKLMKLVPKVPAERQPVWRQKFNVKLQELKA